MKSKTSFFNRTIFKKNVTLFWPIWVAYLAYLFITAPISIWQFATNEWYFENYTETQRMYEIVEYAADTMVAPYMTFIFAAVMALAVFSYLYSAKNANMMHALPVNRLELFVTNYLSGLSFMILPQIIAFFVSVLVCMGNQITCIQYLFFALLCQMGVAFFAYSLAVFVAMFTGQLMAMPVYYLVINYLYIGCLYIVNILIELLCYGVTSHGEPGKSAMLSPPYYLGNNLRVNPIYDRRLDGTVELEFTGVNLVVIYAIAAIFITIAAYRCYRRRQIETAGDWISVGFVKPVFRWGFGICGGILCALIFTYSFRESLHNDVYVCTVLCAIVAGFICFFAAEMLIRKQFKVFQKKRLIEWVGFTAVIVAFITLFEVDAFGIERRVPEIDEIEVAYVYMDYPVLIEGEELETLLEIHRDVIAAKEEYAAIERENQGYCYTTFRYYLKDGSTFERHYPIAVTEEYVENETSPVSRILAWETETENIKKYILGTSYEKREYIGAYIDVYNDNLDYREQSFDAAEAEVLVEAIEKDIEAGHYDDYYMNSVVDSYEKRYYNNISIDYYNRGGSYNVWDYYNGYNDSSEDMEYVETAVGMSTNNTYITFGTDCVNTVRALEKLGVVDDTWKLYTQEEYDEYWAR